MENMQRNSFCQSVEQQIRFRVINVLVLAKIYCRIWSIVAQTNDDELMIMTMTTTLLLLFLLK